MTKSSNTKGNFINSFLAIIEKVGNALPHPATLFVLFALGVVIISGITSLFDLEVVHPGTGEIIKPVSLMSIEGLHRIITSMVTNFTNFAPLGTVLVAMLGIGIAEGSGLIGTSLRLLVIKAPKKLLTFAIVFTGVLSNTASEVGYVLLVPLAAVIFLAVGRHPLAGLAAAFAGVSGGYSANLLLGTIDPLLAGLSEEAARIIDPMYIVNPAANYYFMFVSTFVIAISGTWVTEKIIVPRLGEYKGKAEAEEIKGLTADEKKGLIYALVAGVIFAAILALGTVPSNGFLRDPQ
ncbi:MAG: AbgT family transporter, partial [Ignavibacteriales bacterium]